MSATDIIKHVNGERQKMRCRYTNMLLRHMDRQTSDDENRKIYEHVNECEQCYSMLLDHMQYGGEPTEKELREIEGLFALSPEEQAANIVAEIRAQSNTRRKLEDENKPVDIPGKKMPRYQAWQYLTTAAAVILVVFGGSWGLGTYRTMAQISETKAILEENYLVDIGAGSESAVRIVGNYSPTALEGIMSENTGSDNNRSIDKAKENLQNVLVEDVRHAEAMRLAFQISLIEGDINQAEKDLARIRASENISAEQLNDIGVFCFRILAYDSASYYFEKSLAKDQTLKEARFNLALLKRINGELHDAIQLLSVYIEQEEDPGWKIIAEKMRRRIAEDLKEKQAPPGQGH